MKTSFYQKFQKIETLILSVLLYGIILVYLFQYFPIANKYEAWTTDEFFYYMEAKGISAHNLYSTPASLDGNTSYIGDFGFHDVSYAIKDGWLAKLFFHKDDPPLVLDNLLTCLAAIALILLFKPFSFNTRVKIGLIVATHYILFTYTLSYMQETVQFFFAVLALRFLYQLYENSPFPITVGFPASLRWSNYKWGKYVASEIRTFFSGKKGGVSFLVVILIATTFRFSWCMWSLALLPLIKDFKSLLRWGIVIVAFFAFGIFISRYIMAPYPYGEVLTDQLMTAHQFSILNALKVMFQKFSSNLQLFFTPTEKTSTTCMRYILVVLLVISTVYSIIKRNKFTIACTVVGWAYFISCLVFSYMYWEYDERALAALNPLLAFSVIGTCNSFIFYPVIAIQLWLFPGIVDATKERNNNTIAVNAKTEDRISREATYAKIKDLVTEDRSVVIQIDAGFVLHGTPDYFIYFPIVSAKGYPIHYRIYMQDNDRRRTHIPDYMLVDQNAPQGGKKAVYEDKWMILYHN